MDKKDLTENLNQDLAGELGAIIQYLTYAAKTTGPYRPQLSQFFLAEVADEQMHAIFLANNLLAVVFQKDWHAGRIDRRTRYACRLLCCVPPLICAFAFPSLAKALGFTGIIGIVLPFIVTPMLHAASLRECRNRWGAAYFDACERDSDFAQYGFSSPAVVKASGAFGALLPAYTMGYGLLHGF